MKNDLKWSIIGAGNGGQAMAGHLAVNGFSVKLFDVFESTIDAIKQKGGIQVEGAVQGFGKLELATADISEAIKGANIIVIVLPSLYHSEIAEKCAPYLEDGQIVVLHPGATCGAFDFKNTLDKLHCNKKITVAETQTLLYACRVSEPGHAFIYGIKNVVMVAALPAIENNTVVEALNTAFPQFKSAKNVLQTSLENLNAMMHPAPTILNTGRIDSQEDFLYYLDGITPAIGKYVEEMDKERIELGRLLGLELTPMTDWYKKMYNAKGESLSELTKTTEAYKGIKGQKTLKTRYLLEDVPNSLVPIVSLGKMLGAKVERMETIAKLVAYVLNDESILNGRTVENLGLSGMSVSELIKYVETGVR